MEERFGTRIETWVLVCSSICVPGCDEAHAISFVIKETMPPRGLDPLASFVFEKIEIVQTALC